MPSKMPMVIGKQPGWPSFAQGSGMFSNLFMCRTCLDHRDVLTFNSRVVWISRFKRLWWSEGITIEDLIISNEDIKNLQELPSAQRNGHAVGDKNTPQAISVCARWAPSLVNNEVIPPLKCLLSNWGYFTPLSGVISYGPLLISLEFGLKVREQLSTWQFCENVTLLGCWSVTLSLVVGDLQIGKSKGPELNHLVLIVTLGWHTEATWGNKSKHTCMILDVDCEQWWWLETIWAWHNPRAFDLEMVTKPAFKSGMV